MGGKGASETTNTVRFAPYVESLHQEYIDKVRTYDDPAIADNPYDTFVDMDFETAFFGVGYTIDSFPSLYDMYGKFMAGLDIEVLFDEAFEDTINGPVVDAAISDEADKLSDDLELEASPRYELGMRDMNAVMSSTFVVGKAMMEVGRTKALSRFSSGLRVSLLPIVTQRWMRHLEWNRAVIDMYMNMMKLYIGVTHDITDSNQEIHAKKALWPFTVLEYERAAVSAMNQPQSTTEKTKKGGGILGSILQVAGAAAMFI